MTKIIRPKPRKLVEPKVTAVAIVGSAMFRGDSCKKKVGKVLNSLIQAYPLKAIYSIQEDNAGKEARIFAKANGLKRYGTSIAKQQYHDKFAMAAASLIWRVQRVVVFWDGSRHGLSAEMIQMCMRMKKPLKIFEV